MVAVFSSFASDHVCVSNCWFRFASSIEGVLLLITVSLFGGLGNQMFQYAAAKSLAMRHGVNLTFDLSGFRAHPDRSFILDRLRVPEAPMERDVAAGSRKPENYFFSARRLERIDRMISRLGLPKLRSSSTRYRQPYFHFDPAFDRLGSNTKLFGYFQSERYFNGISDQLRDYLRLRDPFGRTAQATAGKIAKSALPISVHVRRGDYVRPTSAAVHGVLDEAYYRKALDALAGRIACLPDLFVFSDDFEAAAQVLHFVAPSRVTYCRSVPERPWEDMALMACCHHHVIANSSFSWWGAWLNGSREKIVVAPDAWFTQEGLRTRDTRDLYPPGWIKIS